MKKRLAAKRINVNSLLKFKKNKNYKLHYTGKRFFFKTSMFY